MQKKDIKKTRIWLRTVNSDEKIDKEIIYLAKDGTIDEFIDGIRDACGELDEATPVVLKTHYDHFKQFNIVRFAPRDFVESVCFEKMILEQKPDVVIVTTIDRVHHKYIIKAMEMGCDVISEKPMTVDDDKCNEILDAIERTGKNLRVSFNYRYAPHHSKLREIIAEGTIGDVKQIHFEWLLNTTHGADYFRRWHRDKRNSGGLLVHKSTHHFDVISWIMGNKIPRSVFAHCFLDVYGKNGEYRAECCHKCEHTKKCPFYFDLSANEFNKKYYLDIEDK